MKPAALLICIALAGCVGDAKVRALNAFSITCDSYASTLKVLAGLRERGKLSASEVMRVEEVRVVTTPACQTKDPVNPQALLDKIERGVFDLIVLKEQAR